MTREQRAIISAYDLITKEGATRTSVIKGMKELGFSVQEIKESLSKL